MSGEFPDGWQDNLPVFEAGSKMATRASSGKVINAIASSIENFVGGSADLSGSNKTNIDGSTDFQKETPEGKITESAHPARFSPDDKFSRQRIACKKRFGIYLPSTPQKPL